MVQLQIRNPKARSHRKALKNLATRILKDLGNPDAELSIVITDDEEIRVLNHRFRGLDKATDVLSFSQREGEGGVPDSDLLGDVVISFERAFRQGEELGHGTREELKKLLVHGVLHLMGYEHEDTSEKEAERMEEMEEKLLKRRGGTGRS